MSARVEIQRVDKDTCAVVIVSEGVGAGFSSTCRVAQGTYKDMLSYALSRADAYGIECFDLTLEPQTNQN